MNATLAISVREAAARLGISEGTCWAMVRAERIPSVRISPRRVVIPVAALERMLNAGGSQTSQPVGG
jgi:excisionase family DNA binding protein